MSVMTYEIFATKRRRVLDIGGGAGTPVHRQQHGISHSDDDHHELAKFCRCTHATGVCSRGCCCGTT